MKNCTEIIFSTRACNAMISETLDKIPTETGGILLGRVIDSVWYVLESIDPGPNSIFTITYFEYDTPYVNHLANMLSKQYKLELEVLGLWHRHPGSLDCFSNTDNGTNAAFARMTSKGAISGLINIDPTLRLTMYHVGYPLHYEQIPFKIGDHLLPGRLFEYKHSEEKNQISLNQHCLPFVSRNTLPSEEIKVPKGVEAIKAWIKQNASYIQAINLLADRYKKLLALYHNKHIINEQSLEKVLKEEISLDEEGYRYECKTRGSRLIYHVKGYGQNESFKRAIIFSVNVAQSKLVFESRQNKVLFAEGIFVKYINSCLSKTASSIKGELV